MKLLIVVGLAVMCAMLVTEIENPPEPEKRRAQKINPEDVAGKAPPGIPQEEGALFKITGLKGLISYGDSLLVQVSPLGSRSELTWQQHEKDAGESFNKIATQGIDNTNYMTVPKSGNNEDLAYYLFERNGDGVNPSYALRAICISRTELYEPDSGCFFGYRADGNYIKFTVDQRTVSAQSMQKIENLVFSQLGISEENMK